MDDPFGATPEAEAPRVLAMLTQHRDKLLADAGQSWILAPQGDPNDPTDERPARRLMPEAPVVVVVDSAAELAELKRRESYRDMGAALGVLPAALPDFLARLTAPRGPSLEDPTAPCERDSEAVERIKREAGHLFESGRAK